MRFPIVAMFVSAALAAYVANEEPSSAVHVTDYWELGRGTPARDVSGIRRDGETSVSVDPHFVIGDRSLQAPGEALRRLIDVAPLFRRALSCEQIGQVLLLAYDGVSR